MKLVKRLTDNYKKNPESNIGKLLSIIDFEIDRLTETYKLIDSYRAIDNATGTTLDNIGKNILQERGGMDDINYRLFLKTKIRSNLSGGSIKTISDIMEIVVGDYYAGISETFAIEPASFDLYYTNFYNLIKSLYPNDETKMTYLDGTYFLDGEIFLDGGIDYYYSDYYSKILDTIKNAEYMLKYIKAAGVNGYMCEKIEITNGTLTDVGISRISSLGTFPTITHIGIGDSGYDAAIGDVLEIDTTLTVVGNQILKKSIDSFSITTNIASTTATITNSECNGNTIASFGLYEGDNLITLFYTNPRPKTEDYRILINWDQTF